MADKTAQIQEGLLGANLQGQISRPRNQTMARQQGLSDEQKDNVKAFRFMALMALKNHRFEDALSFCFKSVDIIKEQYQTKHLDKENRVLILQIYHEMVKEKRVIFLNIQTFLKNQQFDTNLHKNKIKEMRDKAREDLVKTCKQVIASIDNDILAKQNDQGSSQLVTPAKKQELDSLTAGLESMEKARSKTVPDKGQQVGKQPTQKDLSLIKDRIHFKKAKGDVARMIVESDPINYVNYEVQGHRQELDETQVYKEITLTAYAEAHEEAKNHFKKKEEWFFISHVYATFMFEFQNDLDEAIKILENATNPFTDEENFANLDEFIQPIVTRMLETLENYRDINNTISMYNNTVKKDMNDNADKMV